MATKFLKQAVTGDFYRWHPVLAERADMMPIDDEDVPVEFGGKKGAAGDKLHWREKKKLKEAEEAAAAALAAAGGDLTAEEQAAAAEAEESARRGE